MKHKLIIYNKEKDIKHEILEFELEKFDVQITDEEGEVLYNSKNYNC
jgi:hypothetical protein